MSTVLITGVILTIPVIGAGTASIGADGTVLGRGVRHGAGAGARAGAGTGDLHGAGVRVGIGVGVPLGAGARVGAGEVTVGDPVGTVRRGEVLPTIIRDIREQAVSRPTATAPT